MAELVNEHLDRLTDTVRELDGAVESLILNETTVLEGLAQMLSAVHQMQSRSEENQKNLSEQIRRFEMLIASHFADRNPHKPIVLAASRDGAENPELALLQHLYPFLSDATAIDIGAHRGETAERLLESGYSVIAFEPFPQSFAKIEDVKKAGSSLRAYPWAIGSSDGNMNLHVASDVSGKNQNDPSLFHTLSPHSVGYDFHFAETIPVQVRSLDSLVRSGEIPKHVGLLKIDTEGFDIEVMRGLGELRADTVMAEFWDADHEFGKSGSGRLEELIVEMKKNGYRWHLVIYHLDSQSTISYYHNRRDTVPGSWGNVIFFEDRSLFTEALQWIEDALPPTLFR
jgi:FkbM family methyltransferase